MHTIILTIHVILAVCLVAVILMQRSEGGALGGLGGGGMNSFMTGRSVGNVLTRTTAILATCFMITSLTLAIMSKSEAAKAGQSFLDRPAVTQNETQAPAVPVVPVSSK
ncbi:preprotein translocase SecG subunit [Acetobacter sp. CAG:977]|nr:preprotein translocase SecG subunit [Acetobacter sp. CAG:977]